MVQSSGQLQQNHIVVIVDAGGYMARASESSITLVRESDPENPLESVGANTAIQPGDIVTVGESFF